MIKMIVAMDKQRGIGLNNHLPWNIPEDLKLFKDMTLGHTILMGKKTFLSIGRILPGRTHVVVTHDANLAAQYPGINLEHDLIHYLSSFNNQEDIYIIGGASIYQQALPFVDEISISQIDGIYLCDVFFPELDLKIFELFYEKNYEHFTHKMYRRIKR